MFLRRSGVDHTRVERRFPGVLALSACLAVFAVGSTSAGAAGRSPASTIAAANTLESQVLVELNAIRAAHGLVPLRLAPSLGAAADAHSRAMGHHGFFTHESRDGSGFQKRVERFYGSKGYGNWSVGENLLWATPTVSAADALRLWMASPNHRQNILTARWREIGLSVVTVARAPGVYGGRDVTIMTSEFGARS